MKRAGASVFAGRRSALHARALVVFACSSVLPRILQELKEELEAAELPGYKAGFGFGGGHHGGR